MLDRQSKSRRAGQAEVLTATVSGAVKPTGAVVFLSGATTLCTSTLNASGVATCTFTPAASGALAITAQYLGDADHTGSSASLTLNVYDTSISLQFASTQLIYPGATNVTVCVSGATKATPTGSVQIDDGATALTTLTLGGNGCAYWYISPGLNAGTHTITAVYSGDKNNPPGTSDPIVLTVSPVRGEHVSLVLELFVPIWRQLPVHSQCEFQCGLGAGQHHV